MSLPNNDEVGVVCVQSSGNSTTSTESEDSTDWGDTDRRSSQRRDEPTRPWTSWLTPLRREYGRRYGDHSHYVDRYTKRDLLLLVTIFLLNVGDAFFTMRWLDRGGKEANPVMEFFLDIGPGAFLAQKCLLVGFWLLILVVHKNFRFARVGLYATLVVYAVLMLVHFSIIAFGIEPPKDDDLATTLLILEEGRFEVPVVPGGAEAPALPALETPSRQGVARTVVRPTSE